MILMKEEENLIEKENLCKQLYKKNQKERELKLNNHNNNMLFLKIFQSLTLNN